MFSRLRMRHIRCFLAVAKAGSVTHAARQLNSSQPAVSRTLAEIEEIIGSPLFDRTGRGVSLTDAGAKLMRHFDIALTQIEAGAVAAQGDSAKARVAFGVLPNVARTVAVDAVAEFKLTAPDIDVEIHWAAVDELIARLARGELDFILGRLLSLEHLKGVTFEHLYAEDIIFVARPDHPFVALDGPLTVQDFETQQMLVPLAGTIIRREMDKFIVARGVSEFPNQIETVSFEFTRSYLAQHQCVAVLPRGAVRQELAAGTLVDLALRGDELVSSVGLTFFRDRALSAEAERFADHVRAAARQFG
ncbi:LysR substrate-binding domain-containing protein [Maritimibacter sp.]|uniref:LysR substrate-binding domain-containing protein n=1 Tax=Maritimibacter sp. TaxID=2003363 RepID=UPI00257E6340|nr:LysR substrate-binding domain-containing protein [Maritimibacter sp.]